MEDCLSDLGIQWTDNLANSLKKNWKKELAGTEFDKTNNLDIYCDCLVKE